ncbi:hypothetical protein DKL61_09135 [Gammaproteobacteria bacterium ESL0073]|nr:hypothetical protein DKL61_09135 [Gammaproteobacteria bacterium ESL0073]
MRIDIEIQQGKTFNYGIKLSEKEIIYKSIADIACRAPVRLTINNHNMPDEWPVSISNIKRPVELNTERPVVATVIDENTIEINSIALPCGKSYFGCGVISYYKPYDLDNIVFRGTIRPLVYSEKIFYHWDDIEVSRDKSMIILNIPSSITSSFDWCNGVYDIEALMPNGDIIPIVYPSKVIVNQMVTK